MVFTKNPKNPVVWRLVECPMCHTKKKARYSSFRCCGVQHSTEAHKIGSNPSTNSNNPIESDSIKEAIAHRVEKGELSGEVTVPVQGVMTTFKFESKGASNNPCPPDNPKPEPEGKIKVFNPPKPTNPKTEEKTESKIEKAVEGGGEKLEELKLKEVKKKDVEEALKCPKCDEELTHIKKLEIQQVLKADLPDGYEPYICDNCRILYKVKNSEDSEITDNCPYCNEELQTIRGNAGLFYCSDCHKVFRED